MSVTFGKILALAGLFSICGGAPARADAVSDFYKGKTTTLVVGAAAGAIYDLTARAMAQSLRKHIPGGPNVIVQNMPGASHAIAAEHAWNLAPRDGTSLLVAQPSVMLNKFMNPGARYEVGGWNWIGRAQKLATVSVVWHGARATTLAQARERETLFAGATAAGPTSIIPWALNRLAGTKFKVIRGYDSQGAAFLAMQRGEIEGLGNAALGDIGQWLRSGEMIPLFATGMQRLKALPDIPTIVEVVRRDEDRPTMAMLGGLTEVGITINAPPGIPMDRVAALRTAFEAMARDPGFISDLGRLGFEVDFLEGSALARLVQENLNPPPERVARFLAAIAPE